MSWDDSFARLLRQLSAQHPPPIRNEVSFKVPSFLRDLKPDMYTAHTVSLGLNQRVEPGIGYYKAEFQRSFLRWKNNSLSPARSQSNDPNAQSRTVYTWDLFIEDLDLEEDIRTVTRWYDIECTPVRPSIVFRNFLAVDALFLVLFLRYSCHSCVHSRLPDKVYQEIQGQTVYRLLAEARSGIWRDVFLLENQLPLHILGKAWCAMPDMEHRPVKEAMDLFNKLLIEVVKGKYLELIEGCGENPEKDVSAALADTSLIECDHLLDCLHFVVTYTPPGHPDSTAGKVADEKAFSPANTIPSATQLRKVGITLGSGGCNFIHEIKFETSYFTKPVLHLPRLRISDQTESLLRNLAVFEMVSCYQFPWPRVGPRTATITSFLCLMDKLIQSRADVRMLTNEGIITSRLGSTEEICLMWNTLCKRFSLFQNSKWDAMLELLMKRYKNRRYQLLAEFKTQYFGRPWAVVSWAAGALLILLTALQTFYTILSYYKL